MAYNERSKTISQGIERSPNRAMFYGLGYTKEDFDNPMIGIANGHSTITPCNAGLQPLADVAVKAIKEAGANPQLFGVPTISDGMSMGTEGMKYSLISREVIADCVEMTVQGQWMDGVLVIGGCDKNKPGGMIGIVRANVPAVYVYGGTIKPGKWKGQDLSVISAFEAVGAIKAGRMSEEDFEGIERNACPTTGACGGMYTANTMASSFEALGMSLLYSSTMANIDQEKFESTAESARVLVEAVKKGLKARDIVTRKSVENAITLVMATGGSTNAVLHYLAICHAAEVEWTLDDFERVRRKVPVICDLKPSGKYMAVDLHKAGGIPQVLKILLNAGLLHGDCMTVTGRTLAEELAHVPDEPSADQDVILPIDKALYREGHLAVLRGNLAEGGAVAKITGLKSTSITGPARVFDDEQSAMDAILSDRIRPGDVLVLRYLGPRGGPGMPEMLAPTSAIIGRGLGAEVGLITDGRFSGGSWGMLVGHVTPEAYEGGTIALVEEGDTITIDASRHLLQLEVADEELARRRANWRQPEPRYRSGVLGKFAQLALPANKGAVTG
ncbi:dihydroxy-acid dehydratase [Stappia sp. TSB10P1A]|uniref:dihydroxy-acid dehydratase n=1 Tax=Stappia sp. TSB10P1A TaxID=2003585 RepID=UPI001643D2FE|nr:dihydroxy-acid dehydratase [Stappia sp. TSB10P1A]